MKLCQQVGLPQQRKARESVIVDGCRSREDDGVDWYLTWHPSEPPGTRGLLSTGANWFRQGKALSCGTERGLTPAATKAEWAPSFAWQAYDR